MALHVPVKGVVRLLPRRSGGRVSHDGHALKAIERAVFEHHLQDVLAAVKGNGGFAVDGVLRQLRVALLLRGDGVAHLGLPLRDHAAVVRAHTLGSVEPEHQAARRDRFLHALCGNRHGCHHRRAVGQRALDREAAFFKIVVRIDAFPLHAKIDACTALIGDLDRLGKHGRCARLAGDGDSLDRADLVGVLFGKRELRRSDFVIRECTVIDQDLVDRALEIITVLAEADPALGLDVLALLCRGSAGVNLLAVDKEGVSQAVFADGCGGKEAADVQGTGVGRAVVAARAAAEAPDDFILAGIKVCAAPALGLTEVQNAVVLAGRAVARAGRDIFGGIVQKHRELALAVPEILR